MTNQEAFLLIDISRELMRSAMSNPNTTLSDPDLADICVAQARKLMAVLERVTEENTQ